MPPRKRCSKCRKAKDLSEFSDHPTGALGKQGICKPCDAAARKLKRATSPEYRWQSNLESKAKRNAHRDLAVLYADAYRALLDRHREVLGLPVSRRSPSYGNEVNAMEGAPIAIERTARSRVP